MNKLCYLCFLFIQFKELIWRKLYLLNLGVLVDECTLLFFLMMMKIIATGCRLHNVYGPEPRERTLLWFLMEKEKVSLYNCGQNIRCFTYIDDIVQGLIYAMGCNRPLVNIANIQPVTTMYFANLVKRHKAIDIELVGEIPDFDNLEQSVDQSIYLVPLPYTPVEEGIKRIFDERKGKNLSY